MPLRNKLVAFIWSVVVTTTSSTVLATEGIKEVVSIGTGGVTGVYYPTGGAICRLVNKNRADNGLRCSTELSSGSIYNLTEVRNGKMTFGISQSDWLYHAYKGTSEFSSAGPDKKLRVLFAMHSEPFTVVTRTESNIGSLEDLKGKRVNIGEEGSGHRGMMEALMKKAGLRTSDFAAATELNASAQASALCKKEIDVMIYTVGHPSGAVKEATTACDSSLVNITGPAVDALVSEKPFYRTAVIPGGMYRGNDQPTRSFGVQAVVVTSADVSEETVYSVVKSVFENFDTYRKLHPAFANLRKSSMVEADMGIPMHPGALKYFKEAGLL